MSKDKKTKEKSTKKALIILISALAICFLAGYIVGKIMGKVEKTQSFDAVVTAIRAFAFDAIPILRGCIVSWMLASGNRVYKM